MPLIVTFSEVPNISSKDILAMGGTRATESIAIDGTGLLTARDGEWAYVFNSEFSPIKVAHGRTPDSDASVNTVETSAYYVIGPEYAMIVAVKTGDKFAVEALA